jgi:hypothetical protein
MAGDEIAPEPTGHGLPLIKCEAYNRVYDQLIDRERKRFERQQRKVSTLPAALGCGRSRSIGNLGLDFGRGFVCQFELGSRSGTCLNTDWKVVLGNTLPP